MIKWTQNSFAGGVQDRALRGRQDLKGYYTSARTLENFLVKRQGCISKRRGTDLVADFSGMYWENGIRGIRVIPFVFRRDGGYMVILFDATNIKGSRFRRAIFASEQGVLMGKAKTVDGNVVWELDGWDSSPTYERVDEKTSREPYFLDVPYDGVDLESIGYSQSGDTLWLAHKNYPFARIVRQNAGMFTYEVVDFVALGATTAYLPPTLTCIPADDPGKGAPRTVSYVATYVKGGFESEPSSEFFITYKMPWSEGFLVDMKLGKGNNAEEPDYYNIYKRSSGEYGYIGRTGNRQILGDIVPDNIGLGPCWPWMSVGGNGWNVMEGGNPYKMPTVVKNNSDLFRGAYRGLITGGSYTKNPTQALGIDISKYNSQVTSVLIRMDCFISTLLNRGGRQWDRYNYCYRTLGSKMKCTLHVRKIEQNGALGNVVKVSKTINFAEVGIVEEKVLESMVFYQHNSSPSVTPPNPPLPSNWPRDITFDMTEEIFAKPEFADGGFCTTVIEIGAYDKDGKIKSLCLSQIVPYGVTKMGASFTDDNIIPDVSLTPPVTEQHFETAGKYPSCVAMYNQRLCLAATEAQPFTLWMSVVGDLYNFNAHSSIREDDAIEATVPATEFPEINHVVASKEMLVLSDNGEWVVSPVTGNTITYKTIQIKQQSQIGCSKRLPPLNVGDEIVFSEATNETLRAIRYDFTADGYKSQDLSVLAQSLARGNPIVDYAYKQHPDSSIVCVMKDGTLASLTYMKEHEVCAWSTATLGGGLVAVGVCTDKALTGGTTDLYFLADWKGDPSPSVGDRHHYMLLKVREDGTSDALEGGLCLDAVHEVTRPDPSNPSSNMWPGEVAICTTKGEHYGEVFTGMYPAFDGNFLVGWPYRAIFRSQTPEVANESTIQWELKNPREVDFRVMTASKFDVIPTPLEDDTGEGRLNQWTSVSRDPVVGDAGVLDYDVGDHEVVIAGDSSISGAITLKSDGIWPLTVLSYSVNFEFDPSQVQQEG